jgi:D-glycero-beta-D-manno-heptose-7-phosphate kinase
MNDIKPIILPDFSDLHVIVVGDVMIDRYISGSVRRISPEAPVPVLEVENVENRLGGAANVAINLRSLGAQVTLISMVGEDEDGELLIHMTSNIEGMQHRILRVPARKTTVKTRIMSNNQHILRMDKEDVFEIGTAESDWIMQAIQEVSDISDVKGIILQDYNKGLLSQDLIRKIIGFSQRNEMATFVDPKEKNFFSYEGCTIFKPNKKEVLKAIQYQTADYDKIDGILRQKIGHKITFITLGSEGVYVHDGISGHQFNTAPRSIVDVCGAGDSVISVVSLSFLKGMDIQSLAIIANTAGGQVCEMPGVASIDRNKLQQELNSQ